MPMPGNLIITGEEQGLIEGSCELEDREDTILVQGFDHVVEIPTDERGVASGRRVHRPMTIIKEIDKSTPMLYQALCSNELLTEVTLNWYRLDGTGDYELYYSIYLENGFITRIRPWVPNVLDRKNETLRHMEDISIAYEKIIWTWEPDGIEYEDTWGKMDDRL
jgi:type VI secretion system secreted protein Hcp